MMASNSPRFVPDLPLGGMGNLDALVGSGPSPETRAEPQERVWPDVPPQFELPPASLDDAVREVNYISDVLRMTLLPTPLPGDDIEFCSDILLSFETRSDITKRVIEYTEADKVIALMSDRRSRECTIPNDEEQFNILKRAQALNKHWKELGHKFHKTSDPFDGSADVAYPPLVTLTELPEGKKPPSWKLELNAERAQEADKLHASFRAQRLHGLSYFRTKRPVPMGWAPVKGADAWQQTERAKIESGDLWNSRRWIPIYRSWWLQKFDVPFSWKDPDADEATLEQRKEDAEFGNQWTRKKNEMRDERKKWQAAVGDGKA
ncbi:hypothetical protein BX600DRAFT_470383 [Xylariales sp. PMI_506]|nr:hypothetical protein BX600DRAFT_470383 [Xylariales sp. PMI_506]